MRIDIKPSAMAFLRSLGSEGRPLWDAIESLRTTPGAADTIPERPGRREMHVRIGDKGYWLQWETLQDRSETVIRVTLIEEN
jgi:hypothetical protein